MNPRCAERAERVFDDYKVALSADQAVIEAHRCLYCHDAPCMQACPTHIDIAGFIRKIATGNLRGAAHTIWSANILGHSCARVCPVEELCEGRCVHHLSGQEPIQIGRLQRHATDHALEQDWQMFTAGQETGRRVAVVGGGPAGLACAHELRVLGHGVSVFERGEALGGLNVTGVAPYKMRTEAALEEVEFVLSIGGIDVRLETPVDEGLLHSLLEEYDAVFVGVGLGSDSRLGVEGEELGGVQGAVAWIEAMKSGPMALGHVRHAVVVGGGNTAMDAVRELRGLGVPEVTLVYRGSREQMTGYGHEWQAALEAGVVASWQTQPVGFEGGPQGVGAVRCVRTGADKRPVPGSEFCLPAELVLVATGQSRLGELLSAVPGVTLERGRVQANGDGQTGHPRLFVGGDCANGGKEVVNAAAEGKRAAQAIDAWLSGGQDG